MSIAVEPAPAKPKAAPAAKANPNAWLIRWRKWHTWIGLAAGAFFLMIGTTGIYLNHKGTFNGILGVKKGEERKDEHAALDGAKLASLKVDLPQALALAAPHLDGHDIEHVELRSEHGHVIYRFKTHEGPEVTIYADSGKTEAKGNYEMKGGGFDLGKALKDLHTGKIAGDGGKLLIDLVAIFLMILTASGVYLWIVPKLRKRRSAKQRAAAAV